MAAVVIEEAQEVETEALLEVAETVILSDAILETAVYKAIDPRVTAKLIDEAAI